MYLKRSLGAALSLFALTMTLLACGPGPNMSIGPTPTPIVTTIPNHDHRAFMNIQYCNESTASFNRDYFQNANKLMAKSIADAIRENQDGFVFYTDAINSTTFSETPATSLEPITAPAIGAYPGPLAPPDTPDTSNPVTKNQKATAFASAIAATATPYENLNQQVQQQIDDAKNAVQSQLQALAQWNPPIDTGAQSVLDVCNLPKFVFRTNQVPRYCTSFLISATSMTLTILSVSLSRRD